MHQNIPRKSLSSFTLILLFLVNIYMLKTAERFVFFLRRHYSTSRSESVNTRCKVWRHKYTDHVIGTLNSQDSNAEEHINEKRDLISFVRIFANGGMFLPN